MLSVGGGGSHVSTARGARRGDARVGEAAVRALPARHETRQAGRAWY